MDLLHLVVAGIGTDVGKTVVSAVLCEQLGADYWKPIASGTEDGPVDDEVLAGLISNAHSRVHPCRYRFRKSLSPHIAAKLDHAEVRLEEFRVPETEKPLIIELAGGVAVPLNDTHTNLDLLSLWRFPVVIVSRHYLGSINHTLLTVEALRTRSIPIAGIVFNGDELPDTERIIEKLGRVVVWGRVPVLQDLSPETIRRVSFSIAGTIDDRAQL